MKLTKEKLRFKIRFSIRRMLVAVTIFSIVSAFYGARAWQVTIEELTVTDIQRLGGRVHRPKSHLLTNYGWNVWVTDFIFYTDLDYVTAVSLDATAITDGEVERLKSLGHLSRLDISNTSISDNALSTLADMPSLRYVKLHNTKTTKLAIWELMDKRPSLVVDW